jgi:hypothetical protein
VREKAKEGVRESVWETVELTHADSPATMVMQVRDDLCV